MSDVSGIYKHYEGTDAQCSGIQLTRELTWATDVGTEGSLRYMDSSSGVHYIDPSGAPQYFFPIESWQEGRGAVEFIGPSGKNDYIQFGDFGRIGSNPDNSNVEIISMSTDIMLSGSNGQILLVSDQNVEFKAPYAYFTRTSNDDDPNIIIFDKYRGTSSGVVGDEISMLCFRSHNSASGLYEYGRMTVAITDPVQSSEEAEYRFYRPGAAANSYGLIKVAGQDITIEPCTSGGGYPSATLKAGTSYIEVDSTYQDIEFWCNSIKRGEFETTGLNIYGNMNVTGDIYTTAWTNVAPISGIVGWSSISAQTACYKRIGSEVIFNFYISGTSDSTYITIPLPIESVPLLSGVESCFYSSAIAMNSGVALTHPARIRYYNSDSIAIDTTWDGDGWTASGTKYVKGSYRYFVN